MNPKQNEREAKFQQRRREAEVTRALKHIREGSQPLDTDEFVQAVGGLLLEGENTYQARERIKARVAELSATLTGDSPEEDVSEFLHLHRFARQPGACWSKARKRYRQERAEAIPTAPWGDDAELEARVKQVRAEREFSETIKEAELVNIAFDAVMSAMKRAQPYPAVEMETRAPVEGPVADSLPDPDVLPGGEGVSSWDDMPAEIAAMRVGEETISEAKARLYPILNAELSKLQNQEALLGKTLPRRAEVEWMMGVLARSSEA